MNDEKSYETILEEMLARVDDGMDKREGSIIFDALSPVAYSLAKLYFTLEHYRDLIFPDTSAGEYLDRFALAFRLKRKEASRAVREGTFNIPIELGSRFTSSEEKTLVYTAVAACEQGEKETGYVYEMECETAGKRGGDYTGILIPINYINGLIKAELGKVIKEGTDQESDEAFRERLFVKMQRPSTSGNVNDYYNWAMECTGVGAVRVFPLADGAGTVKIVIADEKKAGVNETLLTEVKNHIEELRPIGASVTVVSAKEKKIHVSAKVKLLSSVNLGTVQAQFLLNLEQYLRGKAFQIEELSLARVGTLLMAIRGVEDFLDLKLNEKAENLPIEKEEVVVAGTVSLEVMQLGN